MSEFDEIKEEEIMDDTESEVRPIDEVESVIDETEDDAAPAMLGDMRTLLGDSNDANDTNDGTVQLHARMQMRRDTKTNWDTYCSDMVLMAGEIGIETNGDGGKTRLKIGDGTTAWAQLPYAFLGLPNGTVIGGVPQHVDDIGEYAEQAKEARDDAQGFAAAASTSAAAAAVSKTGAETAQSEAESASSDAQDARDSAEDIRDDFLAMNPALKRDGYYYNEEFYEESTHTTVIEPSTNTIYFDIPSGRIYRYDGTGYVISSGGSIGAGRFLSAWNCVEGEPATWPHTSPYPYQTGDYYVISRVAVLSQETNYKPDGSQYVQGQKSTTLFGADEHPVVDDYLFYDGTAWILINNANPKFPIDQTITADSTNAASAKAVYNYTTNGFVAKVTGASYVELAYEDMNGNTGTMTLYTKITPTV